MMSNINWIILELRSAATVNGSSTNGFQFVRPIMQCWWVGLTNWHHNQTPQKSPSLLPKSVTSLKNKALGPSGFHLGWKPEEILKRERLIIITVTLVSPARSPVCWKKFLLSQQLALAKIIIKKTTKKTSNSSKRIKETQCPYSN